MTQAPDVMGDDRLPAKRVAGMSCIRTVLTPKPSSARVLVNILLGTDRELVRAEDARAGCEPDVLSRFYLSAILYDSIGS